MLREITFDNDELSYEYDAMDNLISLTENDGSVTSYTYDKVGNLTSEKLAGDRLCSYEYDFLGNTVKETDPLGQHASYIYDKAGNLLQETNTDGSRYSYTYDALGQTISETDEEGGVTSYTYDAENNLTSEENPMGEKTHYTYDKAGNRIKEVTPTGRTTRFTYDESGRMTARINPDKSRISYDYDVLGSLVQKKYSDGSKSVVYGYDAAGNRVSVTKSAGETITVTYNADDQVVSEKNSKTGDKIKYIYDENGNLSQKKVKGKKTVYEYDIENRLRSVSQGGQLLMATTYDGDGNNVQLRFTPTRTKSYNRFSSSLLSHFPTNRLRFFGKIRKVFQMSRKYVQREGTSGHTELAEGDDEEDEPEPEKAEAAKEGFTIEESFDPDIFMYGGMEGTLKLSASSSPSLISAIGHELREVWEGIRTFFTGSYSEGKKTEGKTEEADIESLHSIVVPGTERGTLVTYDVTNYLNDTNFNENSQVMYQYDSKGREKASYVYGDYDERISGDLTARAVKYVDDKAGDYTYLYDGQGSNTQEILKGREANSYDYDPFGAMEDGVEPNDIIFGYNGEEYTEAAGLQYLRSRHYDPQTGTFTSQDRYSGSLQNPNSQNRYAYAENDPVNGNDPGGDKKKSKKTSIKKAAKAVKKAARKAAKSVKKPSKKSSSKKKNSSSKKKSSSKKSSSKKTSSRKSTKSNSLLSKAKAKAKSLYNKGKKALKKTTETIKEKAKRLKKTITCNAAKAGRAVVSAFKPEPVYAGEKDSSKTKDNKKSKKNKDPKKTDLYQRMLLASQYNQYIRANSKELKSSSSVMETIHLILDAAGFAVDIADPINGALYLLEGDYKNAGISFAATIPFVGSLGTTGRVVKTATKVSKTSDKLSDANKVGKTAWIRMTAKEAEKAANDLGYVKTNYKAKNGQSVFYNSKTKTYISQDIGSRNDIGSHNGGVWKMAKSPKKLNSKNTRMGTYDANLNRIGD